MVVDVLIGMLGLVGDELFVIFFECFLCGYWIGVGYVLYIVGIVGDWFVIYIRY